MATEYFIEVLGDILSFNYKLVPNDIVYFQMAKNDAINKETKRKARDSSS